MRIQTLVEQLDFQANTNLVTGLLNRNAFTDSLTHHLNALPDGTVEVDPVKEVITGFTIYFFDLDRFKVVNDSMGYAFGDKMLVAIADRLRDQLGSDPVVRSLCMKPVIARQGSDEFVALVTGVTKSADAIEIGERLIDHLGQPLNVEGQTLQSGSSIGIKQVTDLSQTANEILRDADTAMYRAKATGKGRAVLFDQTMHDEAFGRLALEQQLRDGIDRGEFILFYQPVVSLNTNRITRFEALVRWNHPELGLLSPDRFIGTAEQTGLIVPLGDLIKRAACRQIRSWYSRFGEDLCPGVSVNLSAKQLYGRNIARQILQHVREVNIHPKLLGVELTESAVTRDVRAAAEAMRKLRNAGVHLSIDDFGTGYSSMSTLSQFPFNAIKIDRAFISSMVVDRSRTAIVSAIITLAYNLKMTVIAKGVEGADELQILQGLESDAAQGYLLFRPVQVQKAERMIAERGERFFPISESDMRSNESIWTKIAG